MFSIDFKDVYFQTPFHSESRLHLQIAMLSILRVQRALSAFPQFPRCLSGLEGKGFTFFIILALANRLRDGPSSAGTSGASLISSKTWG